ncbi:MAG: outer membrane protein assembly factor BamD [Crocinitomicaceae bacterium]|jgi:outer membrane protein assembly factor BamD|nr:outer membrane protein assembly factor BamD [Crocinitomicaceae bacterium]
MKYLLFMALAAALLSCSEYNKVLKSDDYQKKFDLAEQLYANQKYERSISLYEQIYQRFPKTGEGELSYYRIGKGYYEVKDYYMAGYYLGAFTTRFPFSPKAQEALFLSAMCSVKNSPEPTLDPTETELAINDLQLFVDRYPDSELVDSCNYWIDELRFKLETKEYNAVKQYARTEYFRAAVVAAESFLEHYPRSQFREEICELLVENSYLLAKNSVESKKLTRIEETSKRYSNFVAEFPNSSSLKKLLEQVDELENLRTSITNSNSNKQ